MTESRHAPGMKGLGFVQQTTDVKVCQAVSCFDPNSKTGEKVVLFP
eukprot:CAMPEP_0196744132 /NCGR_PEP_ID=MMETSP1091-20130531/56084_1 /TAXON_ID=302021 /ORGANISM="Rhodomonas sp., Strain CCMP768" /LENGTH=45 /DNA_ID= /DNA_START= /DNA_END= /DNA_ORIENTATION=